MSHRNQFRVDVDGTIYDGHWVNVEDAAAGAIRRHRYKIERQHYNNCGCKITKRTGWEHTCEAPVMDDVAVVVRRVPEDK